MRLLSHGAICAVNAKEMRRLEKWRQHNMLKAVTLGSISRQLSAIGVAGSITVLYEKGLDGTVYRYGNHGDYWEQIGKLAGWA